MQAIRGENRFVSINRELVALLVASVACVATLLVGLTDGNGYSEIGVPIRFLVLLVVMAGAGGVMGVVVWRTVRSARQVLCHAQEETAAMRRQLLMAEALVRTEPQVLIFWEAGKGLKVVAHSLDCVPGLPADQRSLLRFGQWIELNSAQELKKSLDRLFEVGTGFSLLLKTTEGGHFEAEGRTVGARAVLRLRDVMGLRRRYAETQEAHAQLVRDIQLSRKLFDNMKAPIWFCDPDGRISWANKAYIKTVDGVDLVDVMERQLDLLEERQRKTVQNAIKKNEIFEGRFPIIVEGERRGHDVVLVGEGPEVAGVAMDTAELETAQHELDRQTSAFDRTLDRIKTAVAIYDSNQRLTFFNEAFARLWGLDEKWLREAPLDGEVLDRLCDTTRLPAVVDYRAWKADLLSCYGDGEPIEDWWHLPNGQMLHVTAERRSDGGVTYLYEDATERLALESRYNELIDVQRETLDSMKEGVVLFGSDGRLKLFNSVFAQIWHLSPKMLESNPHVDEFIESAKVTYADDNMWRDMAYAVTAFSEEREITSGEMQWPDNRVIDYAIMPLPDGATLITFIDVTDSRRYERTLVERNEALVAADRLKSQFIGHVSYELRTPLTNIIGFSELLVSPRTGPLNRKQREYLNDIRASSMTLLSIIDDILDLTTMDAGALDLKVTTVQARDVIEAAVQGVSERAQRSNLTINVAVESDPLEFAGDPARIRQVLYNLLSNAVGYSEAGGKVALSAWCDGDFVVFEVRDEGVGIPRDQVGRVFERFESIARGAKGRGAGLGLAIVKSIVELHGGSVAFESDAGQGATVTTRFPVAGPNVVNDVTQREAS